MRLDEMLIEDVNTANNETAYIPIADYTHANEELTMMLHATVWQLAQRGGVLESALEMGMLWVVSAIRKYGLPSDLEELLLPISEAQAPPANASSALESLLDGIDVSLDEGLSPDA